MLVKTEMIEEIGLLDKEFFTFREENDWCMRGAKEVGCQFMHINRSYGIKEGDQPIIRKLNL